MLTIAGGIVLGVIAIAILPYLLEFLANVVAWTLVAGVILIALLVFSQYPELILYAILFSPVVAVFLVVRSINKHGSLKNWLEYIRVVFRGTKTADDVARKAQDLRKLELQGEDLKKRRHNMMFSSAVSNLHAQLERKITRFAPEASVRVEESTFGHAIWVGPLEIGHVDIYGKNRFLFRDGGSYSYESADVVASRLRDSLKRKLKADPDLISKIVPNFKARKTNRQ